MGCGYIGQAVGQTLALRGERVVGICRNSDSAEALREKGIQPCVADITSLDSLQTIPPKFDAVVDCVSSGGQGDEAYRAVYVTGTRNLLEWAKTSPPKIMLFTSSTTVYPQTNGEWVDESSPTDPAHSSGKILLKAERLFLESGLPVVVLRLGGIYGPGRHALLDKLRSGVKVLAGEGRHYLNMIHRDDIVQVILAALDRKPAGQVFNVVDDEPTLQIDAVDWLCQQLKLPPVQFDPAIEPRFKGRLRRGFQSNRRIRNQKMKAMLDVTLRFPTFREGLLPLLEDKMR